LGLRDSVKRLEKRAFADGGRIRLKDGSIYRYDAMEAGGELWAYCIGLLRVKYDYEMPPEPEILRMIRAAKDPRAAMQPFRPDAPERAFVDPGLLLQDDPETSEDRFLAP
jgi:hypothetical protein